MIKGFRILKNFRLRLQYLFRSITFKALKIFFNFLDPALFHPQSFEIFNPLSENIEQGQSSQCQPSPYE